MHDTTVTCLSAMFPTIVIARATLCVKEPPWARTLPGRCDVPLDHFGGQGRCGPVKGLKILLDRDISVPTVNLLPLIIKLSL